MPVLRWLVTLATVLVITLDLSAAASFSRDFAVLRVWRFFRGDATVAAAAPGFDDSAWRDVAVPHDWSIEGPFAENAPTGAGGGFLPSGVAWYRYTFSTPAAGDGRAAPSRVELSFDGILANSEVWIDGHSLGRRPNGYVPQHFDLTPHLTPNTTTHVIAVRTDTSGQPASRWYTGAGIYRTATLTFFSDVSFESDATVVTTPQVSDGNTVVQVRSRVRNDSDRARTVTVRIRPYWPGQPGQTSGEETRRVLTIPAHGAADFAEELSTADAKRWEPEAPAMGSVFITVREGEQVLDFTAVPLGVREFRFAADSGFWINGRNVKIKGVCLHHDGGAFGAAVPIEVWEDRLRTLRAAGVNAIRTAHNPPSSEFLHACDQMGFLVLHEIFDVWTVGKRTFDYARDFETWSLTDLRDTVRRDRNHPSIFAYSAGNEIHDTPKPELAKRILGGLIEAYHREDPTRPVTQGLFRPNRSGDYKNGLADMLDVVGQNYRDREILAAHREKPTRKILGTENGHDLHSWIAMRDYAPHAGQFLWAGIDYLGESRGWPYLATDFGLLDRTGHPYPRYFQRASWWSDQPVLRAFRRTGGTPATAVDPGYEGTPAQRNQTVLFDDWSPVNLAPHEETVEIYSNLAAVELELNGRSLGSKSKPADDSPRQWKVAFAPGELRAIGRDGEGHTIATHILRTAGAPAKLVARADRIGEGSLLPGDPVAAGTLALPSLPRSVLDVARPGDTVRARALTPIEFFITDAAGNQCPRADSLVTFEIEGRAHIAAVDNGDNLSHESFRGEQRRAFGGRVVVWVGRQRDESTGWFARRVKVTARAEGLAPVTVSFSREEPTR